MTTAPSTNVAPLHIWDDTISHSIMRVTPDMAKRWLDNNNSRNRDISPGRVNQYVSDMEADRWEFNGEPMQFDRNGMLLNGQHRLCAIVSCGIPQTFLIVRGLDPRAQITMDQGTRRSPVDQLGISGVSVDKSVAAAVRVYIIWNRGLLFGDAVSNKVTTSEVVAWVHANPDQLQLLRDLTTSGIKRAPATPSTNLAVALKFSQIDEAACLRFFDKLITGADLDRNSPILALRTRLLASRDTRTKLTLRDQIGFYVMAWNAEREGRGVTKLQRPRGLAWQPDNFPEPK